MSPFDWVFKFLGFRVGYTADKVGFTPPRPRIWRFHFWKSKKSLEQTVSKDE